MVAEWIPFTARSAGAHRSGVRGHPEQPFLAANRLTRSEVIRGMGAIMKWASAGFRPGNKPAGGVHCSLSRACWVLVESDICRTQRQGSSPAPQKPVLGSPTTRSQLAGLPRRRSHGPERRLSTGRPRGKKAGPHQYDLPIRPRAWSILRHEQQYPIRTPFRADWREHRSS